MRRNWSQLARPASFALWSSLGQRADAQHRIIDLEQQTHLYPYPRSGAAAEGRALGLFSCATERHVKGVNMNARRRLALVVSIAAVTGSCLVVSPALAATPTAASSARAAQGTFSTTGTDAVEGTEGVEVVDGVEMTETTQGTEAVSTPDGFVYPTYTRTVQGKLKISSAYINRNNTLASCTAGVAGATCSITRTSSASVDVQLALSATRGLVTGSLGITNATSIGTSVACNSPAMKAGQRWVAFPRGDRYSYKINQITKVSGKVTGNTTSATLYAFKPRANDVYCTIA